MKVIEKAKEDTTMSVLTYIVLIGFAIFGLQHWLKNKSYIFVAEDIAKIAKRHVGNGKSWMHSICNTLYRL